MTGRWTYMDASSTARSTTRVRAVCVAATVLCALGVLSGVVVRSSAHAHHHHGGIAAAVTIADGQGTLARGDQSAVTVATPRTTTARLVATTTVEHSESADQFAIGAARQRGPPARVA